MSKWATAGTAFHAYPGHGPERSSIQAGRPGAYRMGRPPGTRVGSILAVALALCDNRTNPVQSTTRAPSAVPEARDRRARAGAVSLDSW
jgi:hypothetical protein